MKRFRSGRSAACRTLTLALCLALALTLAPAGRAAAAQPVKSRNINAQDYSRWSSTVNSYLYENPQGGLTRVEYTGGQIVVEDYDSAFQFQSGRTIPMELTTWGGFFAGQDYNFFVFGQNNPRQDDSVEVIRVVKYSKDWQRLGQASLNGANTTVPFDAGSLRCAEYGGYLYIRTCHEMYKSDDGYNHQSNLTMAVRQDDMTVTDSYYGVLNSAFGFISHSFNQFILVDQTGLIVAIDHGDAYPRGVSFNRYYSNASTGKFSGSNQYDPWCSYGSIMDFAGQEGDNTTGANIGGLAETTDCYIFAYCYDRAGTDRGGRYPFYHYMDKATGKSWSVLLSQTPGVTNPVLAPMGLEGGYELWNGKDGYAANDTLYYISYNAQGQPSQIQTAKGSLSDCQPIAYNGKAVWYTTDNSTPVFYALDSSGVTAIPTAAGAASNPNPTAPANPDTTTPTNPGTSTTNPGTSTSTTPGSTTTNPGTSTPSSPAIPATGTAHANTQTVLLDGKPVTFETYALWDANGGVTNYIKLRDMAYMLNGTGAQFSVGWERNRGIFLTSGSPYTPNGSELSTPFSGDRTYRAGTADTMVGATKYPISSIILTDDKGGDYTYYKLRDLGTYLDFNVSFIDGQVVVTTNEPYSADQ